jgi:hypothetical protein
VVFGQESVCPHILLVERSPSYSVRPHILIVVYFSLLQQHSNMPAIGPLHVHRTGSEESIRRKARHGRQKNYLQYIICFN